MNKVIVSFYLKAIAGGGQSKVLIDTASGLAKKGYKIIFYFGEVEDNAYIKTAHQYIEFIQLNSNNHFDCFVKLSRKLKKNRPNILVSGGSINNCVAILASFFTSIKVVVTEHISISSLVKSISWKNKLITPFLVKKLYPFSSAVVAVSQGVKNELVDTIGLKHHNLSVIYNPVVSNSLFEKSKEPVEHKWLNGKYIVFLGVGRLHIQKDFINLINAFNLIAKHNNFKLIILGEGEDRPLLQNHIDLLDLRDKVELVGRVDNPYAYMRQSDIFVLSSRFEGFGNVLVEAMACGLPVIATDCPHGPNEILENGKWGMLVPTSDPESLSEAMLSSIDLPKGNGIQRAMVFSVENSVAQYHKLIQSTLINKSK